MRYQIARIGNDWNVIDITLGTVVFTGTMTEANRECSRRNVEVMTVVMSVGKAKRLAGLEERKQAGL